MLVNCVSFPFPKVYPITDTEISGLSHAAQVKHLIEGGATLIQLREKHRSPREFFADALESVRLAKDAGVRIIINDRVDIALAARADGVHLGQTDMPVEAARQVLGDEFLIGYSTHDLEQFRAALELPINYIAFGPVHGTTTKENPDPVVGLEQLRGLQAFKPSLPIVAIGGISESNARQTLDAGADSLAIISAFLADPARIAENIRRINDLLDPN